MEIIRKRLELESTPSAGPAIGQSGERISPPHSAKNLEAEDRDGRDLERRRGAPRGTRPKRLEKDSTEDMETDLDRVRTSPIIGEDVEAVFRPPPFKESVSGWTPDLWRVELLKCDPVIHLSTGVSRR